MCSSSPLVCLCWAVALLVTGRKNIDFLYLCLTLLETTQFSSPEEMTLVFAGATLSQIPCLVAPRRASGTPMQHRAEAGLTAGRKCPSQHFHRMLWGDSGLLCLCPSQKPAHGHCHWHSSGDSVLHPHEYFLLHGDDSNRAPAVPGRGCGK